MLKTCENSNSRAISGLNGLNAVKIQNDMKLSYCSDGFVLLSDIAPEILQDIRYCSKNNFTGGRVDGYEEPCAILTKEAAEALKRVSESMIKRGYLLKVFDAYRPQRASECFKRWSYDLNRKKRNLIIILI